MEKLLAGVWKEVLRQQSVGIYDNFFHIGGDSIKAIQISGRLGLFRVTFFYPTLATAGVN